MHVSKEGCVEVMQSNVISELVAEFLLLIDLLVDLNCYVT